jgi:serine/threonine protein kinase
LLPESTPVANPVPETNVLIGDDDKALLCDFGLFRLKREAAAGAYKHVIDISIDNPFWISPECLGGRKPDTRSDIYSFGMVIFEVRQQQFIPP